MDEILTLAGIKVIETEAAEEVSVAEIDDSSPKSDISAKAILPVKDTSAQLVTECANQSGQSNVNILTAGEANAEGNTQGSAEEVTTRVSSGECAECVFTEEAASKQNAEEKCDTNVSVSGVSISLAADLALTDVMNDTSSVCGSTFSETLADRDTISEVSSIDHDAQSPINNNQAELKYDRVVCCASETKNQSTKNSDSRAIHSPDSLLSEESLDSGMCSGSGTGTFTVSWILWFLCPKPVESSTCVIS